MKLIKTMILNILMGMIFPVMSAGAIYTNGVYCEQGKTVEIDKSFHQIVPANKPEFIYFSNDLIAKVDTNADFTINSFFQEVLNTNSTPEKLNAPTHNFAATLTKGTCIVTYEGGNENSSCVISTPFTDHELSKGTFYFQVNENRVIVYTVDGKLKTTSGSGKTTTTTPTGYAVIAVNNESNGILESKISFYTDKLKQSAVDKILTDSKDVMNLKNSVMFIRIDGKTTGVAIN